MFSAVFWSLVIWVLGRKELEGLAGVVAEDLLLVGFGAVVAAAHGEVGVALGVLALAHLDGGAATAPAVGGEVFLPEGVAGREGDAMQQAVALADVLVSCGAVLEVVAVAVALYLLPAAGHEGGAYGVLVLGAEVVVVVGARDGKDVFLECVEGFDVAAFVGEAEADFAEAVVGLEGGEDEGVVLEGVEGGGVYVGGEVGLDGVAEDGAVGGTLCRGAVDRAMAQPQPHRDDCCGVWGKGR